MGSVYPEIDEKIAGFIKSQPMFFVGTAPLSAEGRVNLSPKGYDSFRVLDSHTVAYLDMTGSGIETMAHLKENGRIVFMFCSFTASPMIVRLHGRGEAIEPGDPRFADLRALFPESPGTRSVVKVDVTRVTDSCGWGVPIMDLKEPRQTLINYAGKMGEEAAVAFRAENNATSIDGLPGVKAGTPSPAESA